MLIDFSVSNFRSIRERQTLSMVAAPRLGKRDNCLRAPIDGEKFHSLLKVAAIYGPNASGKSSLIRALGFISEIISRSDLVKKDGIPVDYFRFDDSLREKPSTFEVAFIASGLRYQFNLSATKDRIVGEELFCYPKGRELKLYSRIATGDREVYDCSGLGVPSELYLIWQKATGPRGLFISTIVENSSDELSVLKAAHFWLSRKVTTIHTESMSQHRRLIRVFTKQYPHIAVDMSSFLRDVDVPVTKIEFEGSDDDVLDPSLRDSLPKSEIVRRIYEADEKIKTRLTHETSLGEAEFSFEEESSGTQNLMAFWLPWRYSLNGLGSDPGVLVIDEFDSSLHPEIVRFLIKSHIESGVSSQLIFTTHDTHLMETKLLRRDQFWITERDMSGATRLTSIYDFQGREGEDVEKRYFEGRYRGLPILR